MHLSLDATEETNNQLYTKHVHVPVTYMYVIWCMPLYTGMHQFFIAGQSQNCTEGKVKLVTFNPNDPYAGIVEVCHNGVWGTICADSLTASWSEKNAHIACWNVQYPGALNSVILST